MIGLPAGLFYGTGIPACVLVMHKKAAAQRKHVIFINADREFREGKAQNFLRPEDISKIVHVYRTLSQGTESEVPGYARRVPVSEIDAEDFNCNIRRYVDKAPPPEPHDVRAHLHGGVPVVEIESLGRYWSNYTGLRERVFQPRESVGMSEGCFDLRGVWRLHQQDLKAGSGRVQLPHALAVKYPNADCEWCWQFVFPAPGLGAAHQ